MCNVTHRAFYFIVEEIKESGELECRNLLHRFHSAAMSELVRDTVFGHLIRLISHGKLLPYAEDRDPELWRQYVHHEKTERLAHHGHVEEEPQSGERHSSRQEESRRSSRTLQGGGLQTNAVGHTIDPENGKDVILVHWYGDKDPEVSLLQPTQNPAYQFFGRIQ